MSYPQNIPPWNSSMDQIVHEYWMQQAILLAKVGRNSREVPIGAIIVRGDEVVGRGYNLREQTLDPTAHAEMIAIRDASQYLDAWRLLDCRLYVTLEPCPMCAGAISTVPHTPGDIWYNRS